MLCAISDGMILFQLQFILKVNKINIISLLITISPLEFKKR